LVNLTLKTLGSDIADEPEDLSQIPQLIRNYLIVVKEQQRGKKLKQDFLRVNVAWKVKDLSNDRYTLETIFDYYDRLYSQDAQVSALISSICGGEPLSTSDAQFSDLLLVEYLNLDATLKNGSSKETFTVTSNTGELFGFRLLSLSIYCLTLCQENLTNLNGTLIIPGSLPSSRAIDQSSPQ